MTGVTETRRLVTVVKSVGNVDERSQMSFDVRLEAELSDGSRVLLLGDRGWSVSGPFDLWERVPLQDIADTARVVVGPDEPRPGWSADEEAAAHWGGLAVELARHGVQVDGPGLLRLPHDVELDALD